MKNKNKKGNNMDSNQKISELQNHLQSVLGKIDQHKTKHNLNYGNLDKFLEHAAKGAQAKDYQAAAMELFAALKELNDMTTAVEKDLDEAGSAKGVKNINAPGKNT